MQKPKKIALDMDEVIVNFVDGILDAINLEFGSDLKREQITEWDMGSVLNPVIGYSWWKWLESHSWVWAQFKPTKGAIGAIDKLAQMEGVEIEIVTSKPEWAVWTVWKWLGKYRPNIHKVIVVKPHEKKCQVSDAEILVDDNWDNCYEWGLSDHARTALLWDAGWNQGDPDDYVPFNMLRVHGWDEVLKELGYGQ